MNIQQTFPLNIFRAYDIRGKLSNLTPDIICSIAYALAQQYKYAEQTQIVIGYDARLTSPSYANIIQKVLEQQGLNVTNIGCCSSPMMYYIARDFGGNGIMVTASHNPKSDNGIKWILKGEPPSPEIIQQVGLAAQFASEKIGKNTDLQELSHHIIPEFCLKYQQSLLSDIQLLRPLKIVLDGLHGSAGHCAKQVLQNLGCEVIALRCEANGHSQTMHPIHPMLPICSNCRPRLLLKKRIWVLPLMGMVIGSYCWMNRHILLVLTASSLYLRKYAYNNIRIKKSYLM